LHDFGLVFLNFIFANLKNVGTVASTLKSYKYPHTSLKLRFVSL